VHSRGRGGIVYCWSDEIIVFGFGHLTLADFDRGLSLTVALAPLVTLAVRAFFVAIAYILHLAVTVGAPWPVTVATLVVALAAIVLARREGLTLAAGRGASAARRALASTTPLTPLTTALGALTTGAVPARVEAPRCRGRRACPLHLIC
jgi:hypothetical protein